MDKKKSTIIIERIYKDILEFKWAILLFLCYYILTHKLLHAFCPMVIITGLPCPGCGMTRAIVFLLTGQVTRSLYLNPFAIFWIVLGGWCFYKRYIKGEKIKGLYPMMGGLCGAMILYYIYRMCTVFPSYPPMSYRSDNALANLLKIYKKLLLIH